MDRITRRQLNRAAQALADLVIPSAPSRWIERKSLVHRIERTIVVPVPAVEPITGPLRDERIVASQVPPHVTLLGPFIETERLDRTVLDDLANFFGKVRAFPFDLDAVGIFEGGGQGGTDVIWLRPVPPEPFVELTNALSNRYDIEPYEGAHDEVRPHLTVTYVAPGLPHDDVYARLTPHLPIACRADHAILLEEDDSIWRTNARFRFSG